MWQNTATPYKGVTRMSFWYTQPCEGVAWQKYINYIKHTKNIKLSILKGARPKPNKSKVETQGSINPSMTDQNKSEQRRPEGNWFEQNNGGGSERRQLGDDRSVDKDFYWRKGKVQKGWDKEVRTAGQNRPPDFLERGWS